MERHLLLSCSLISLYACAQQTQWVNHTSSGAIRAMEADQNTMWLGTDGGSIAHDLVSNTSIYFNKSNSGLPSNRVNAIATDGQGNVWFGTEQGLARFNGIDWTTYTISNSPLADPRVTQLDIDPNGALWLCGSGSNTQVVRVENGNWSTLNVGLPSIRSIACLMNGHVLVGTYSNGLAEYDGSTWIYYDTQNSPLTFNNVVGLSAKPAGGAYVQCGSDLFDYDGMSFVQLTLPASAAYSSVIERIVPWGPSGCVISTANYLDPWTNSYFHSRCMRYDSGIWEDVHHPWWPSTPSYEIGAVLACAGLDEIWASGGAQSLYRFDGTNWSNVPYSASALTSNQSTALEVAADGTVWCALANEDILHFDGNTWEDLQNGMLFIAVNDLEVDPSGHVVAATATGIRWYNGLTWDTYNTQNSPLPTNEIQKLFFDQDGALWIIPYENGVLRYDGSWTHYTTANTTLTSDDVQSITQDDAGVFWIGTGNGAQGGGGISRFDGNTWTTWGPGNSDLPYNLFVSSIAIDANSEPWFVLTFTNEPGMLAYFDGNAFTFYDSSNTALSSGIEEVAFDAQGTQWISSQDHGLFYRATTATDWSNFNAENSGIAQDALREIAIAPNQDIWMTTGVEGLNQLTINWMEGSGEPDRSHVGQASVIPDPVDEHGAIFWQDQYAGSVEIWILDALGRTVARRVECPSYQGDLHRSTIDAQGLKNGAYTCRIMTDHGDRTARFIVSHL